MPRFNIEHKGKWACFSSIVDGFVTPFMEKSDYENWRKTQYGNCKPAEESNLMDMKDAVVSIRLHNTHYEAITHLFKCGIDLAECEKMIYDLETEQYCPVEKDGKYFCPNCGMEVERGRVSCFEETCEIVFVWR